jgi:uncharacterized membrane protein
MLVASLALGNFDPPWLWTGLIVLSLGIVALTYRRIFLRSGRRLAWALMAVRGLGVAALLLALVKPVWTRVSEHKALPRLAVVVDDSESMSLSHAAGDDSRYATARRWWKDSPVAAALRARFDVRLLDLAGRERPGGDLPAEPLEEQTDLVRAVRAAASRLRGTQSPGILLVSDGRDTTARGSFLEVQEQSVPVYTLGFRSRTAAQGAGADYSVVSVDAPESVLVHNTVSVGVLVRKDGGPAAETPLTIERAGTPMSSVTVSLPEGRAETLARIPFKPDEPGEFVLTARIPARPGEPSARNNQKLFKLRVAAEPIRALYVEGVLRSECTFLRERLGRDPDIDLVALVRAASPGEDSAAALIGRELFTRDRLGEMNVVILGDMEADLLDRDTFESLREWVEKGGGLMVLGGYHSFGAAGLALTPLKDALPVELAGTEARQVDEPFSFSLTPEGALHPIAAITGNASQDAALWQALPKLGGAVAVQRAKPGATVLARHPARNPAEDAGYVVLAVQPYGKGVAVAFTADTTWRWSRAARLRGEPDALYARFWSQAVRFLARRDPLSQHAALVVSTESASCRRGERVPIRVRRDPAGIVPGDAAAVPELELTVRSPDGRSAVLPIAQDAADPDAWVASFFPSRGGRHEVAATLAVRDKTGLHVRASQSTEFVVEGSDLELEDATANPAALAQIARLSGGLHADIADEAAVGRLADAIPSAPRLVRKEETVGTWNSPLLFLAFLSLVTAEWIVRRRNGLA